MYDWRKLTPAQRQKTLAERQLKNRPWHSPPHRFLPGHRRYIISAACYEHAPIIAYSPERMDQLTTLLLEISTLHADHLSAWCILPNHYHLVLQTPHIKPLLRALGLLHGRTSFQWNGEENSRGRKVWCNAAEREMRSDRHLWASINYVHHNPVKHGYVTRWQDWPWSSATTFLNQVGPTRAKQIWQQYPLKNYGQNWDD